MEISRRGMLLGRGQDRAIARPVGAPDERRFVETCTRCGACASACPEGIIAVNKRGLPFLDFSRGGCSFCSACQQACEPGVLQADRVWQWQVSLGPGCLSVSGVQCRICQDHCGQSAITFHLRVGGSAWPEINSQDCTGCGFCIAACPTSSLSMEQRNPNTGVGA